MHAVNLRTNELTNPIGIDQSTQFLSWTDEAGIKQTAYQIQITKNSTIIYDSGRISSVQMHHTYTEPLFSRSSYQWQVKLWDEKDNEGLWSQPASFETGILDVSEWKAKWILPEAETPSEDAPHQPASYLTKTFYVSSTEHARIYITAHGIYTASINGHPLTNALLTPGCGEYDQCMPYNTFDISSLLKSGDNQIDVTVGDGWYRSCTGVAGDRNLYGNELALLAQIEVNGQCICATDDTWLASQNGPIRMNDLQQGETYDARLEEVNGWHPVRIGDHTYDTLACAATLPVTSHEQFIASHFTTPDSSSVYDFSQNLNGTVEIGCTAHLGDTIQLILGETLDENGNFTTTNFQPGPRHQEGGIKQTITYICKEGKNTYTPSFTISGFRYAKIITEIPLQNIILTAHAIYSDMEQTASFHCSNKDVDQLFQNTLWSMKSNFCDIPTDCPTREKAGWTGDAGVFVDTGLTLMDCAPVLNKWLKECRICQYEDGRIANIAPRNGRPSMFTAMLASSVGWGDACIIVPYALYKRTGDLHYLSENYAMMKRWYTFLQTRAKDSSDENKQKYGEDEDYIIDSGIDYGEWCEPGVGTESMKDPNKSIGTAYLYHSGRQLAEIAVLLNDLEQAHAYEQYTNKVRHAYQVRWTDNSHIHSERQAEYVRAISFGLIDDVKTCADDLNTMVIQNGYHLNTGFLSTPFLCSVLAENGHCDTAYQLLLQTTAPSWLYEVHKGATTIWERWEGIDENNHPTDSLNHYSYGAVSGWLISGVCGILAENETIIIAPLPDKRLRSAEAEYRSPLGTIRSSWQINNGSEITYDITLPSNTSGIFQFPDGRRETISTGKYQFTAVLK